MFTFKQWLNEVNLTFSQFLKRTHLNLNRFYEKVKKRESFQTEDGKQIRLLGLAIKLNNDEPIKFLVDDQGYSHDTWVETITAIIEKENSELSKNIFVILDNGELKPLSILSKSSTEVSLKSVKVLDSTWGALSNLPNFTTVIPRG